LSALICLHFAERGHLPAKFHTSLPKVQLQALLTQLRPTRQPVGYQTSGQFCRLANQKLGIMVSDVNGQPFKQARVAEPPRPTP
jgi:hypothetical protein